MKKTYLVIIVAALFLAACSLVIDGRLGTEPDPPPVVHCP